MVERVPANVLQGRRGAVRSPGPIDASSGSLAAARQLGVMGTNVFQRAANNLLDEVGRQVADQQLKKGREIGLEATTTLPGGQEVPLALLSDETSIAARSRNQGIIETYTNRLNTTLFRNMEQFARNNNANPGGYEEEARSFYQSLRGTLPNDELKASYDAKFESLLQPEITRQHTQAVQREREDTRFSARESVDGIIDTAERDALDAMSPNMDLARTVVANIAQRRGELAAVLSQADANGVPIFTPDQQQAVLQDYDYRVQKSAVLGGFRRAPDKAAFIERWTRAERKNRSSDALSPTRQKTQAGRRIFRTPDGNRVSEISITVIHPDINDGKPTNIPSIFDGEIVTEDRAIAIVAEAGGIDPDTGRELEGFDTIAEAEDAARARSAALRPVEDDEAPNADFKRGVAPMLALQDVDRIESTMRQELREIEAANAEARARLRIEAEDARRMLARGERPAGYRALLDRLSANGMTDTMTRLDVSERLSEGNAEFARLPMDEQRSAIEALDNLAEVDIFQSDQKAQFRKIHAAQVTAINQGQGLRLAAEAGVIGELQDLDFSDPTTLSNRAVKATLASEHIGARLSPLTPEEARGLKQAFDDSTPSQVTGILETLSVGLGEEQAGFLAGQLVPDNPELAAAITLAPDRPLIARDIVLGGRLLAENPDVKPNRQERIDAVEEVFGNMFTPESAGALSAFMDAGTALYASRRVPTGDLTFDSDTFEQALRDAAGEPVKINDRVILPPRPGMTEDEVEDLVLGITDEDLTLFGNGRPVFADGTPFSVAFFDRFGKDAQLVTSGPGQYLVFFPGLGFVQSDTGGAYEINLRGKLE